MKNKKISESVLNRSVLKLITQKNRQVVIGGAVGHDCSVIDAGDKHGNNGRDTEIQNQPGNRGFRHFLVMRLRTGQEIAFFLLFSIL